LQIFDQPVIETNCTRRESSTVASQALTLLNSDFMVKQAEVFAARVLKENAARPAAYAVLLVFGRPATETELGRLNAFLESQSERHLKAITGDNSKAAEAQATGARRRALADLCHMLLSANEFAYVD